MTKLIDLKPTESTVRAAQESYSKTLAKHHSWLIRNGAILAMNLLPCRKTLYHQVSILHLLYVIIFVYSKISNLYWYITVIINKY